METKKSIVKEIKNLNKKDTYGNNSFIVKLETGEEAFFKCKTPTPPFKEGDELPDAKLEQHTKINPEPDGTFKKYWVLTLPKKDDPAQGWKKSGGFTRQPRTKQDVRSEVPFKAADKVVDMVINGKIVWEQFNKYYKELCTYLYDEIDGCFAGTSTEQGAGSGAKQ